MTTPPPSQAWSADLYDSRHGFVARYGGALLDWLAPRPGERILDLGCGTGALTDQIAQRGAEAIGVDASEPMIARARAKYPALRFIHADAAALPDLGAPFDGVFSNAVLHWLPDLAPVAAGLARVLRHGGRFVMECGGLACTATILDALRAACAAHGVPFADNIHFRSLATLAAPFEEAGFRIIRTEWFPRNTLLEGPDGMFNWLRMFRRGSLPTLSEPEQDTLFAETVERLRPTLLHADGWHADYTRQRLLAIRL